MTITKYHWILLAIFAGSLAVFSCRPQSGTQQSSRKPLKAGSTEAAVPPHPESPPDCLIETRDELIKELDEIALGKDETRVIESALHYCEILDELDELRDESTVLLNSRFKKIAPAGFLTGEVMDELGLIDEGSKPGPQFEMQALASIVSFLAGTRPDLLQSFLLRKSEDAVQKESDLIVYSFALEGVLEYLSIYRNLGYEKIAALVASKNPIYRLLAAKLMPSLEYDKALLAGFYEAYVDEKDETILDTVMDGLVRSDTVEAIVILREIAEKNREHMPGVAESAEEGMENLKRGQVGQ